MLFFFCSSFFKKQIAESNIWAKLLLQFIEYCLDQLNNKHTKIRLFSKKISDIWLNENAQYVYTCIICITGKSDLPITYSVCETFSSEMLFFTFCLFPLPKFLKTIVKNLIIDFEGS